MRRRGEHSPYGSGSWDFRLTTGERLDEIFNKVDFGWPIGMPYCRSLGRSLWEVRCDLSDGRIGRVIFCVLRGRMVLLHGFVKKTPQTPAGDLELAWRRKKELE